MVLETHRIDKAIKDAIRTMQGGSTVAEISETIELRGIDRISVDVIKRHLRSLHTVGEIDRVASHRDNRAVFCWKISLPTSGGERPPQHL